MVALQMAQDNLGGKVASVLAAAPNAVSPTRSSADVRARATIVVVKARSSQTRFLEC